MNNYLDLFTAFFKIGLFTFGGGYAMLPMLESEVVNKKKWATYDELMDFYAVSQCTPGVIAVNVATLVGYNEKKVPGAVVATAGVVCPSLIIILIIASLLTNFADLPVVVHALAGIRIAVCVLILKAVVKLMKNGITDLWGVLIFIAALICSFFNLLNTVVIVIFAAAAGILIQSFKWRSQIQLSAADRASVSKNDTDPAKDASLSDQNKKADLKDSSPETKTPDRKTDNKTSKKADRKEEK